MLRSVFAIALMAACHPAPAPTVVHATPLAMPAATTAPTSPIRQDFELLGTSPVGPLHEVLATGHECEQERQGPTGPIGEQLPRPAPLSGRRLIITVSPDACQRHRNGQPLLH